jgi:spore germination cell wall hydrolase CwlJ-like protein
MRIKSSVGQITPDPAVPVIAYAAVAPSSVPRRLVLPVFRRQHYVVLVVIFGLMAALVIYGLLPSGWLRSGSVGSVSTAGAVGSAGSEADSAPPVVKPTEFQPISPEEARASNAKIPFAAVPLVSARPFRFEGTVDDRARARDCLAAAVWYEAGDEPTGQSSVAQVVLNRARHPAFPADICAVVFQGADRSTGCQFTFTCDGSMARRKPGAAAWARAQAIADSALSGRVDARVGLATHYHTNWVMPYWSASLDKMAQVGSHLFFKWRGYWGTPAAFRSTGVATESKIPQMAALSPAHQDGPDMANATLQLDTGALDVDDAPRKTDLAARAQNFPVEAVRGTRDLKGNMVTAQSPDGRRFLVALNPQMPPHIYALTALQLCRGKADCDVQGWLEGQAPDSLAAAGPAAATLRFRYQRTATSGDHAKWDCKATPRPSADQCL